MIRTIFSVESHPVHINHPSYVPLFFGSSFYIQISNLLSLAFNGEMKIWDFESKNLLIPHTTQVMIIHLIVAFFICYIEEGDERKMSTIVSVVVCELWTLRDHKARITLWMFVLHLNSYADSFLSSFYFVFPFPCVKTFAYYSPNSFPHLLTNRTHHSLIQSNSHLKAIIMEINVL